MDFYFVKNATTNVGPIHFPVFVDCHHNKQNTLAKAVDREARTRGIVVCHDWGAQPIDRAEFRRLAGLDG